MTTIYTVACTGDDGIWVPACRRFFATAAGARRYARTVAPSRRALVVPAQSGWFPGFVLNAHYDAQAAMYGEGGA